jgi:serine phosphatase RsbU (regulator of sigma subunit)/putative methionine-R-sulfoxide reductase with GAF domain
MGVRLPWHEYCSNHGRRKETAAMMNDPSHPAPDEASPESLAQEAKKNLLIQEAINALLRISLRPISLDEQLHRVLELILGLPWLSLERKGCIYQADETEKLLVMKAQIGMPAGALATCSRVPFGTCLCGRAIAANELVFADCVDACHNIRYAGMQPHGHYCVPISAGMRRIDLLNLYVREGHQQSPEEARFLRAVADVLAGVIERQRAQERLQEQLRLAEFASDIGQGMCHADSLPDMLRWCAEAMVRHLNGAFARIWTLNEADNVLELQASAGLYTQTDGSHRRVPVGRYKIGLIAQERKSHLTNAVLHDPLVHNQAWAKREGLVAFAGYPLLVEKRLVGVMAMFARHPLSEATLEAMASVANGLALGIERIRTQERLQEQLIERMKAEVRLIEEHGVSRILAVSSNLNDAALKVLQAICETLDWDFGAVWVVDPNDNLLRCAECWHRPEAEVAAFEEATRSSRLSQGTSVPGRVWSSGKLVWFSDVSVDATLSRHQVAAECGLHGAVGFPIQNGGVQGVLEFFSREIRPPDDELTQMMSSIGSQITLFLERRQAQEELQRQAEDRRIARQVQQALLPKAVPMIAGFQISGRSVPAQDVGGDCFDFFPMRMGGEDSFGVFVADASGHGIGAAMLVAQTRAYLRALGLNCTGCTDVGALLTLINQRVACDLVTDHFVTLFLLQLDPRTRCLIYAGAGHWPGYVLDRQGRTKAVLASTGVPLGINPSIEYPAGRAITLEPGELVLLFTDGIIEASRADGRQYGLERTLGIVQVHQQETPDAILEALFQSVTDFSGHAFQDDATSVIIKAEGLA